KGGSRVRLTALALPLAALLASSPAWAGAKKRPLYVIAHRCNDPEKVTAAVAAGANAIECDPRWGRVTVFAKRNWFIDHDGVYAWSTRLDPWLDAVAAAAKKHPHFT